MNGDAIFPAYLETIRQARVDDQLPHLRLLAGRHRTRGRRGARDRARDGLDVNLLLDAVGTAKMERDLLDDCATRG